MEKDPVAEKQLQGHKAGVTCLAFNPRDKSIASGDSQNVVMLWNLKKSATALKLQGHTGPVLDLNFSPKTNLLASASQDRSVRLWVPTYSGHSTEFRAHFSAVRSVHFSPDGERIVTGSDDKSVKLWSLEGSRRFISSMSQHSNWVRCTRFSPHGNIVGSCSDDCSAILWDTRDPKKPVEMLNNLESSPHHLAFQPGSDGVFALAFASGHVRVYDIRAPQHLLQSYKAHSGQVNQLAFHPSGHVLISGSSDGEIKVLDLLEGRPIYTLSLHKGAVTGVAFSPGGQLFASCGEDRQVIVWRTNESCPSPQTPSANVPSTGPRTPVSGDPRSPMSRNEGWRKLSQKSVGVTNGLLKTATNNDHDNKTTESIKALEERVRRLEALLQVSPRSASADPAPANKEDPLADLDLRIMNMEERVQLDDSANDSSN